MKKNPRNGPGRSRYLQKLVMTMKLTLLLTFCLMHAVASDVLSQQRVTMKLAEATIKEVLAEWQRQTGTIIIYSSDKIETGRTIRAEFEEVDTRSFFETVLAGSGMSYKIMDDYILIIPLPATPQERGVVVKGRVTDADGAPLPGVTIRVKGTTRGGTTDIGGNFQLSLPTGESPVLLFTFVGMKPVEVTYRGQAAVNVVMEIEETEIEEVVVTGIFTRTKESFTGSSSTYTGKELKTVGSQNLLQSLKTLDPSFAIIENNQWGSDPNRLPDINVRGKTSVIGLVAQEYETDPNQPLFILDGFESTLATINDLSMDRVESITVLKDAAATAIYGSKAANGVIVVETKAPVTGQLRLNYNGSSNISFADLSDYNLMNAAEKLEFEKQAGYYYTEMDENGNLLNTAGQREYYARLAEIQRGVDSYWLSEPLRVALTHGHTLYTEGGDQRVRYGVGFSYKKTAGVMKGSDRDAINGNFRLIYRYKTLAFNEYLNIDYTYAEREKVPFSQFSRANPYYRKRNEHGEVEKVMATRELRNGQTYVNMVDGSWEMLPVYNPLYDASLSSYDKNESFGFRNNFEIEWKPVESLRARGRFSISKSASSHDVFRSPFCSDFIETAEEERGRYTETNGSSTSYDGDLNISYGELINEVHLVNVVGGLRVSSSASKSSGYTTRGFIDDKRSNPAFSTGFPQGSQPAYSKSETRSASFYLNSGYVYDGRYLLDANIRSDGASMFGSARKFAATWAVGLAWNLHNEAFFREIAPFITQLKLRYSVGNPGNQNFEAYIASHIYKYITEYPGHFGLSALINQRGNPGLAWQKTIDNNYGIDIEVLDRRLRITADYYTKDTDPLLVYIPMPASSGTTQVPKNMGRQLTTGYTATINATIISREEMRWSVNLNARHQQYEYQEIEAAVAKYNRESKGSNLRRFYDGGSPNDLWAVPSAGIDPMTGKEMFIKKDGTPTFLHDYNDEVLVGNTDPDLEGVFGTSFYYKGFTASMNFRYRYGGQIFLQTLYDKVENITSRKLAENQDKRALHDRWQKPGDVTKFKNIRFETATPISSRFVANENTLTGESISLGYETTRAAWLKRVGASSLTVRGYMNDIFRLSTVKDERGIDYPFARSVSFSLGLRF